MGKLVSLLLAGCGASAVSVGGVYLLRRTDVAAVDAGSAQEESSAGAAPQKTLEEKGSLKFTTLEEFRSNKGYKCSVSMFSGKDLNLANLTNVGDFSNSESFLGTPATDKSKIKSCLVINWEKKTYSTDKWTGLFTWT